MSDSENTTATTTPPVENAAPPADAAAGEQIANLDASKVVGAETTEGTEPVEPAEPGADEGKNDEEKDDELPQWARNKIADLNGEAAKWRTQLRDLQKKTEALKTPEEFEAALREFQTTAEDNLATLQREIDLRNICDTHKVPKALQPLVTGKTVEEMTEQAKLIATGLQSSTPDPAATPPGGGLDPMNNDGGAVRPDELARAVRGNRRRR